MKRSYHSYAMGVIVALPDARDGSKPVHRHSLRDVGTGSMGQSYNKSARTVATSSVNTIRTAISRS
jgi:DNA gyrase/topoisomerase IV subunit A